MQPQSCAYYYETTANFILGTATVEIEHEDYEKPSVETFPVKATVSNYEPRGTRETCGALSRDSRLIYRKGVSANLKLDNRNWLQVTEDSFDSATLATDHIMLSILRNLGNEKYEVHPSQIPASNRAFWSYSHSLTWGTSGDERLKLKF